MKIARNKKQNLSQKKTPNELTLGVYLGIES